MVGRRYPAAAGRGPANGPLVGGPPALGDGTRAGYGAEGNRFTNGLHDAANAIAILMVMGR